MNQDKEFCSEEIDRIVIDEDKKKIKIVLSTGERILVDFNNVEFIE